MNARYVHGEEQSKKNSRLATARPFLHYGQRKLTGSVPLWNSPIVKAASGVARGLLRPATGTSNTAEPMKKRQVPGAEVINRQTNNSSEEVVVNSTISNTLGNVNVNASIGNSAQIVHT